MFSLFQENLGPPWYTNESWTWHALSNPFHLNLSRSLIALPLSLDLSSNLSVILKFPSTTQLQSLGKGIRHDVSKVTSVSWDVGPRLDHIFIQLGPAPPTPPSLPSLPPTLAWELFPAGNQCDNTRSLKPLKAPLACEGTLSSKLGNNESDVTLNICNFDRVLSHWFPTRKSFHTNAGRKTGQWRRHGRDGVQLNEDVI